MNRTSSKCRRRLAALLTGFSLICMHHAAVGSPLEGTSDDRIVVFGDVHGGAGELRALLRALTLIDDADDWRGGQTRLVSLGDLLDRGPDSRAVMDLLMKLEKQAAADGGQLHMVLGNHEIMNLTGDLRYVSEAEYAAFAADEDPGMRTAAYAAFSAELIREQDQNGPPPPPTDEPEPTPAELFDARFPPGYFAHRAAFSADGRYGSWLLSKPQVLILENIAFVHGGLSEAFVSESIDSFNVRAERELRELLTTGTQLVAAGRLPRWQDLLTSGPVDGTPVPPSLLELRGALQFDRAGPSWYRGTAACHPLIERPRFEAVLEARQLDRVVMGHTPTNPRVIQTRFEDRAVLADTGMYGSYYKGRPSAVIFDRGEMRTLTLDPDGILAPARSRPAVDIRAGSQQARLDRLAEALSTTSLIPGDKVTVKINGRRQDVTWHKDSRREQNARLAALALDRLLGFGLIAPVVFIEQNGRGGVAEIVPATALSEKARATGNIYRPNHCLTGSDFDLLLVLDALMGQETRTGDNVFYGRASWLIYLTEQNRAFPKSGRLPRYVQQQTPTVPPLVVERLAALTVETLTEALGEYLDERQIQAILSRRDLVLEQWSAPEAR